MPLVGAEFPKGVIDFVNFSKDFPSIPACMPTLVFLESAPKDRAD